MLVNTYSGVVKISDFGTSKRLAGINPCTETFTGTLQYMAPEIIDKGPRGYGAPADIWSLGCTMIEMATGKPPFHELGEPQAAMFKVGMFKIHPEIPESLSAEAKAFILLCFEPDPFKRAAASDLLRDSFLKQVNKGKKSRIAFKPSDYNRNASLPLPIHGEQAGSSSSEHGSVSPDSDVQHDVFFERPKRSISEIQTRHPIAHLLSVPDEGLAPEDRSASPSTEDKDSGLFLLRKDSERRAILYKILKEEQNKVASNLQDCIAQSSEELRLSMAHIKQIIGILRDFIHSPEHRVMASTISKLKMDLDFDSTSINQIHLVLFGFQDAVNKVLRNHLIRPHWMFAMDNIIRRAVQAAVTILIPELQAHFEPASETEGGDKDCDEVEDSFRPSEQNGTEDAALTSGVSTLSSVVSHEAQQQLSLELGRLKQETIRLLEKLVQKEKEYQTLLQRSLEQKTQELHLLQLKLKPADWQWPASPLKENADPELTNWLKQQGADLDTIRRFAEEDYTLSTVLNDITKDDLRCLQLRGGLLCRIWNAILIHRQTADKSMEAEG